MLQTSQKGVRIKNLENWCHYDSAIVFNKDLEFAYFSRHVYCDFVWKMWVGYEMVSAWYLLGFKRGTDGCVWTLLCSLCTLILALKKILLLGLKRETFYQVLAKFTLNKAKKRYFMHT